jgi:hypothetical protein
MKKHQPNTKKGDYAGDFTTPHVMRDNPMIFGIIHCFFSFVFCAFDSLGVVVSEVLGYQTHVSKVDLIVFVLVGNGGPSGIARARMSELKRVC